MDIFDLSNVRLLLADRVSLDDQLSAQLPLLEAEKEKFDGAYNLCVALSEEICISEEKVKTESLDADRWYDFVRREEAAGHAFVDCWQDIPSGFVIPLFEPLFVKDLRKNKRKSILANGIGLLVLCALVLLIYLLAPGYFAEHMEPLCVLALLFLLSIPRCLLGKKHPRTAIWVPRILLITTLLALILLVSVTV